MKIDAGHLPNRKLPHCAVRAQERYGITLDSADVRALARRCHQGEGLMETKPDGSAYHTLVVGERVLWLVYRRDSRRPYGTVVTIMPPAAGNYRSMRDHRFMNKRLGKRNEQTRRVKP